MWGRAQHRREAEAVRRGQSKGAQKIHAPRQVRRQQQRHLIRQQKKPGPRGAIQRAPATPGIAPCPTERRPQGVGEREGGGEAEGQRLQGPAARLVTRYQVLRALVP